MLQPPDETDVVNILQQELGRGSSKLFDVVPTVLRTVIAERLWAQRADKAGAPFASFEAFVVHPLWWGLEATVDDLIAYCRNAPDVQAMIRGELAAVAKHGEIGGGHTRVANGNSASGGGNEATYAIRRLKRDRPDLAEKVIAGKMSPNAAAIEAGFRVRMVSLPADPERLADAIVRRFPDAARLIAERA